MAGVEVGTVYFGVAGEHVAGRSSHGVVSVTSDEIRTSDVARVNDVASNISFGRDHELLHAIPQDYLVDQQGGITEPIGMTGSRLEAEVYLVTVLSSVVTESPQVRREGRLSRWASSCSSRWRRRLAVLTPRRAGAGLCHRGAGRRINQRGDLPAREDPAHGVARCSPAGTSPTTSFMACR